jgi:hypothetical protein
MPLQLSHARNRKSNVPVPFAGETINVVYRPGDITSDMFSDLEAMEEETGKSFQTTPRLLALIISEWDIMDGDKPVDITESMISSFPLDLQATLQQAILTDLRPGEANAGNSAGGSFRKAK